MAKLLKTLIAVAVVCSLAAGVASAGQNTAATARLYWMSGTTSAATSLGTVRNSTANIAVLQATVTGLVSFKGEDLQLIINALDNSGLPPAWQATGLGGPADGNFTAKYYTYNATAFPDAFLASPAVTGIVKTQDASAILYNDEAHACLTPHLVGVIWLSAAGGVGRARTNTLEYGVYGFKMVLNTGCCTGDNTDPNPLPVCIAANWRQPCKDSTSPRKMQLLDINNTTDFAPFDNGYEWLTWHGELFPGSPPTPCPAVTPVAKTTWGALKRLYR